MKKRWIVLANLTVVFAVLLFSTLYIRFRGMDLFLFVSVVVFLLLLLTVDLTFMLKLNRRLEQTAVRAERASRSKSEFLSNMSHEIRTPITAILGMNEMIQREGVNPDVLEYSHNIEKAGVSLLGIISDILDFSKIEAGHMELVTGEYSLSSVLCDLYNLTELRAQAKGLSFEAEIDPMLPVKLVGDELRIKQIITNLLTNAVKYTERGSVRLILRLQEFDQKGIVLYVAVKDTGIGIREEEMEKLFTAFDRLDTKRTRTIEGSGLGLAITREMLGMMESELKVESVYGEGSVFSFLLRQEVADWKRIGAFEPAAAVHERVKRDKKSAGFKTHGARILIVDDTPMNIQVFAGLLKRTGVQIDIGSSGEECLKRFGEKSYDMVFLDYRMPVMDGIETLQELKRRYPREAEVTPVISLTASAVAGDREMMLSAGFDDYLTKPVNYVELEEMLLRYLPAEKVDETSEEKGERPSDWEEEEELSELRELRELCAGLFEVEELDLKQGIDYCGDAEDYLFALETWQASVETKAAELSEDLNKEDIGAYTILVHSLKSTSLAIGAMEISGLAKALELAGKNGDRETILRDTQELLEKYRGLGGRLKEILETIREE
ncbi:MAG: response regulator [Lachnospiraceae bacterium]|nr:response regulator [Lachnospiraceae bacterium]